MDAVRLRQLLLYCRLEEFAGDEGVAALLESLYAAAVDYLRAAGVTQRADNRARFDLAVNAMVLHWYDKRGDVITGTIVAEIPLGLRQLINQLKITCLVSESDTNAGV